MALTATPQIQRVFNNARVKLPGAVDDMLKLEFYNVLFEFFEGSNIWQETISLPVNTTTNIYDVDTCDVSQITRLMGIVTSQTYSSINVLGTMQTPGALVLKFVPNQADTYLVTVAKTIIDPVHIKPTQSTVTDPLVYGMPNYPEWVVDKYIQGFIDGLIGRMMSQVAKPYSNQQMAVYHLRKFQMWITTARNEANRQNVYGAQRWIYPQDYSVPAKGLNAFR